MRSTRKSKMATLRGASSRGAVAVEMAVITPVLVLMTCGTIDIAQYINSAQLVSSASREGARKACRFSTQTTAEVEQAVLGYLSSAADVPQGAVQVKVLDGSGNKISPGQLPTVRSGDSVGVEVTLTFDAIRLTNWLSILNGAVNTSTAYARRE